MWCVLDIGWALGLAFSAFGEWHDGMACIDTILGTCIEYDGLEMGMEAWDQSTYHTRSMITSQITNQSLSQSNACVNVTFPPFFPLLLLLPIMKKLHPPPSPEPPSRRRVGNKTQSVKRKNSILMHPLPRSLHMIVIFFFNFGGFFGRPITHHTQTQALSLPLPSLHLVHLLLTLGIHSTPSHPPHNHHIIKKNPSLPDPKQKKKIIIQKTKT